MGDYRIFHWASDLFPLMGIMVVAIILLKGLDKDMQSKISYKWVLVDIALKCLQSFSLFLGT